MISTVSSTTAGTYTMDFVRPMGVPPFKPAEAKPVANNPETTSMPTTQPTHETNIYGGSLDVKA